LTLGRLLDCHTWSCSFTVRLATERFGHGPPARRSAARRVRCLPTRVGFLGPPGRPGGCFLRLMTRSSCHGTRVDLTPLSDGSSETPKKIMLPTREPFRYGGWCSFFPYIAHFSQKSKLYGWANANFCHAKAFKLSSLVNDRRVGSQDLAMPAITSAGLPGPDTTRDPFLVARRKTGQNSSSPRKCAIARRSCLLGRPAPGCRTPSGAAAGRAA
jgi:hypothetical protein